MVAPSVRDIFDTQVAAGFAGLRAQLGYEALLHEMVGVRLRKSASFTRWDARPLSDEQVGYAREDVLHLLQLADALQATPARPRAAGLGARGVPRARGRLRRARARGDLPPPAARQLARALASARWPASSSRWREETARETDRPVPSVLADAALVEVAKRRPATLERLAQIRGLNESTLRRRGRAILEAVERGRERDPIPVDGDRPTPTDAKDAPLIALGEALVRARALGGRARLRAHRGARRPAADRHRRCATSSEEPDVRTLQGWRRAVVGDELLELLQGRRSLRVGPGRTIEVTD